LPELDFHILILKDEFWQTEWACFKISSLSKSLAEDALGGVFLYALLSFSV